MSGRQKETECLERIERLYEGFIAEFGKANAKKIFDVIMKELGSDSAAVSFAYYRCRYRNRQIRKDFCGDNYGELAIRYDLTEGYIRRIVHSEEE